MIAFRVFLRGTSLAEMVGRRNMKMLVAVDGNTLNHLVATHFESAEWYLTVGDKMSLMRCVENLGPRSRKTAIEQARDEGVGTVVTCGLGVVSYSLVASHEMRIAIVPHLAVREVLTKLRQGSLKVLDSSMLGEIAHDQILRRMEQRTVFREKESRGTIKRVWGIRG